MSSQTTATLTSHLQSLLPTYAPPAHLLSAASPTMPAALLSYALSLLARSRSRAATLKPDEEVARAFAVAHLAADRLKQRLNLPEIRVHPPCPPKVYQRLFMFLDAQLTASTDPATPRKGADSGPSTPRRTPLAAHTAAAAGTGASVDLSTPTKSRGPEVANSSPVKRRGPGRRPGTPGKKRKFDELVAGDDAIAAKVPEKAGKMDIPEWVVPMVRALAGKFATTDVVPHVYVGVVSVLKMADGVSGGAGAALAVGKSSGRAKGSAAKARLSTRDEKTEQETGMVVSRDVEVLEKRMHALVGAVLWISAEKMFGMEYSESESEKMVQGMVELKRISARQASVVTSQIDEFMKRDAAAWRTMEWHSNIPDAERSTGEKDNDDLEMDYGVAGEHGDPSRDVADGREQSRLEGLQKYGLGTMRQARIDWYSEDRRESFLQWKASVLKQCEQIERQEKRLGKAPARAVAAGR